MRWMGSRRRLPSVTLAPAAPDAGPLGDLAGLQGKAAGGAGEPGVAVDLVEALGLASVAVGVDVVPQG